jgi:hypothetical protein
VQALTKSAWKNSMRVGRNICINYGIVWHQAVIFHPLVKGVEIDKPKGGKRLLGVPTVLDRLIQLAIQQILYEHFDNGFSRHCYGYRKGKNAHKAIHQALDYVNNGSKYVVDKALSNFFDRVNHDYCFFVNTQPNVEKTKELFLADAHGLSIFVSRQIN